MFTHKLLTPYNIHYKDSKEGRYYKITNNIFLPSVTTVLGRMMDHSYLDEWRERIGHDEANKIMKQASYRGNIIHKAAEKYLMNDSQYANGLLPVNLDVFNQLKIQLDKSIKIIYGIELPLYSLSLHTAGRCDLISDWNGELAIVDFKTSRNIKEKKDILSYFYQVTIYAYMMYALYKIKINKIVILMATTHDGVLIFEDEVKNYLDDAILIFKNYKKQEEAKNGSHI